ncbi:MAG: hypothetical protein ACOX1A_02660 [Saccharofermentanales bacterium]
MEPTSTAEATVSSETTDTALMTSIQSMSETDSITNAETENLEESGESGKTTRCLPCILAFEVLVLGTGNIPGYKKLKEE